LIWEIPVTPLTEAKVLIEKWRPSNGLSVLYMGTSEQKEKLLPKIDDGSVIISFALAEPGNKFSV